MPVSTIEVLFDLLEEQENAVQAIAVQLSSGQDLSPPQLEAMLNLKQHLEETRGCLETMIQERRTSDIFYLRARRLEHNGRR